jgi:hypothetical protein
MIKEYDMKFLLKTSVLAFVGLCASTGFTQQSVQWDTSRAIMAGNGCIKDYDAFVSENGNDLAAIFTNLGVNLPGGASRVLAGRSACSLRVPATIAPGLYIGALTQRISYGVVKTARTRGSIATRSTFFGFNVSPYTVNLPYGASINGPLFFNSRQDLFSVNTHPSWYSGWCSPRRAPRGMYQANFAISGQKDNSMEDLIMFVDGLDLRYEVVAGPVQCQI